MSDCHDAWGNLEEAVSKANEEKCEHLLFAGDLNSPPGVGIFEKFNGEVILVWGNNEGEKSGLTRKFDASKNIKLAGDIYEGELDGVKIFMNHYPRITELAAKSGEFDICVFGHTHDYEEKKVGNTLLVNPGEIQGLATGEAGFVIFDTETKKAERITSF